ncbi:MAG TPA: methylmalonyl-CoA mutase family protein, partial [Candidatus Binatia bacterium]
DAGERTIVGVNAFTEADEPPLKILRIKESVERQQIRRLRERKKTRSSENVTSALANLARAAADNTFLMPSMLDAVRAEATVGEICDVFRKVYGEYREPVGL